MLTADPWNAGAIASERQCGGEEKILPKDLKKWRGYIDSGTSMCYAHHKMNESSRKWAAVDEKIAVMVIDKQALFRAGVRQALALQSDLEVLDGDPDENAMSLIETKTPDVVLLDIDYPSLNGLGLGRKIAARYPSTRVVLLSSPR